MSSYRTNALIEAPPPRVWDLVGNPSRHVEWWPRVIEVRGERFDEGDNYAQVTRDLTHAVETTMQVEQLDEVRKIHLRCTNTGTFAHWLLTEARGNTFVEVTFGMDPIGVGNRIFDAAIGRIYFRRWLTQSLAALQDAARAPRAPR
jgi:hypothetical protein